MPGVLRRRAFSIQSAKISQNSGSGAIDLFRVEIHGPRQSFVLPAIHDSHIFFLSFLSAIALKAVVNVPHISEALFHQVFRARLATAGTGAAHGDNQAILGKPFCFQGFLYLRGEFRIGAHRKAALVGKKVRAIGQFERNILVDNVSEANEHNFNRIADIHEQELVCLFLDQVIGFLRR